MIKDRGHDEGPAAVKLRGLRPHGVASRKRRVEMAGIEPASNGAEPGLLRVQFAALFSAPAITRTSRRRAQSLFDFPSNPVTGLDGLVP